MDGACPARHDIKHFLFLVYLDGVSQTAGMEYTKVQVARQHFSKVENDDDEQ